MPKFEGDTARKFIPDIPCVVEGGKVICRRPKVLSVGRYALIFDKGTKVDGFRMSDDLYFEGIKPLGERLFEDGRTILIEHSGPMAYEMQGVIGELRGSKAAGKKKAKTKAKSAN